MQNLHIDLVYYRLCDKEMFYSSIERAKLLFEVGKEIPNNLLCNISIERNNKFFLKELECKIISKGYEYLDYWLRGLISDYVKRKSIEDGDTPYYSEYYISWLNNTRLVINNQHPTIQKWCDEYESLIKADQTNNIMKDDGNKNVFIVHGHSKMMLLEVTNYIASELHLNPIVLSNLPNNGMTIIEKFERFSSDVQFAIILLSPDDVGGIDENHLKGRARQNVIFEFGYFVAKLGRNKVCALLNQDVEKPSDIDGVLYLPYDNHWKFNLLKEIKNAGVPV